MAAQQPNDSEPNDHSDSFADVELIGRMEVLGFKLYRSEGIADWFTKDEGTSQLTVFGAREMARLIQDEMLKARREEISPNSGMVRVTQRNHVGGSDYDDGWNACWNAFWTARWNRVGEISAQLNQPNTNKEEEL